MSTHRMAGAALVLVWSALPGLSGCSRTVTVQAISEYGGTPIAGVEVQVDDGAWATTDENGKATFRNVSPPFILGVHQITTGTAGGGNYRFDDVWQLRDPEGDPVVVMADGSWLARHAAMVTGSVSGGAGGQVRVYATANAYDAMSNSGLSAGTFTLYVQWERPGPLSSVLRAVETDGASPPGHYLSYGETAVTLTDPGSGGTLNGVPIPMDPVSEEVVGATVTVPPGLDQASLVIASSLRFSGGGDLFLGGGPASSPLSVPFPQISGSERWLSVRAISSTNASSIHQRKVTVPSSGLAFELLAPAELVEPADQSAISAGTSFRWNGGSSGEQAALSMVCDWTDTAGVARSANFRTLETSGTEAVLPDLPDLTIDSGARCFWQISRYSTGYHLGATLPEASADEYRYSLSESREATFQ